MTCSKSSISAAGWESRSRSAGQARPRFRISTPGRIFRFWAKSKMSSAISSRHGNPVCARACSTAKKFEIDVRKTPIPRFDLLKFDRYLYVGVQFSRGCPFTCEFCDIIELYGRVPRTKTNAADAGGVGRAVPARLSRPCRFRRRQSHRQQESGEGDSAGTEVVA